ARRRKIRARERAVLERPAGRAFANETRFHVVARCEREQLVARRQPRARERAAHEQRRTLPVAAHELARSEPAEELERLVRRRRSRGDSCRHFFLESVRRARYKTRAARSSGGSEPKGIAKESATCGQRIPADHGFAARSPCLARRR